MDGGEGVLYIGRAQEKARVLRTERRHDPRTGAAYPWLVESTAFVNHYYVYAVDDDFGPFFLKFCSYFPYNAKLYINGHEYLKRQLTKRGIAFEALDNGILRCADPVRMQRLADGLTAARVDALLRKWLARLPHSFAARDRQRGIRYERLDSAGGVRSDPGIRPPGAGAGLLRRGAAREPRHGSPRPRAVDLSTGASTDAPPRGIAPGAARQKESPVDELGLRHGREPLGGRAALRLARPRRTHCSR